MPRSVAGVIFLALFMLTSLCFAMPKPLGTAVKHERDKTTFYSGTVYLSSHDDTVRLKELGFCAFEYEGRCFRSLKYKAQWPLSAVYAPVPDYVNGMNYDVTTPERELIVGYYEDLNPDYGDYSGGSAAYPSFGTHRYYSHDDAPLFVPTYIPAYSGPSRVTGGWGGGSCRARRG